MEDHLTDQPRKRVTIDAPDESTILAARHLDPTEGRVHVGSIIDTSTRSAINRVIDYIAEAHNAPPATPAEQDVSRVIALYEQWVKAGPPPLGVLIARWWDARLVELHHAIRPADEPQENR